MELPGTTYLFNLSLISITFTAVSALVMLVRQTMGGRLSNFDVYLITSYISFGFVLSLMAVLPPLISLYELSPEVHWAIASGLAAVLHATVLVNIMKLRRTVSPEPWPFGVKLAFAIHWFALLLLVFNAVASPWQGAHVFATSVTIAVADILWSFVRRIASLLGEKPGEDWDPKRG
jgi:hypothetical protein